MEKLKLFYKFKRKLFKLPSPAKDIGGELTQVLNAIAVNYWWKDKNGKYLGCNEQTAKLLGLKSANEIIGMTDFDMPWSHDAKQLIENDNQVIATGQLQSQEETVTTKDNRT